MKKPLTLKADLHVHSCRRKRLFCCPLLFDCVQTIDEILSKARELDIKILSITDHDTLEGYFEAKKIIRDRDLDILLVPGCEITTREGHILALNIKKEITRGLPAQEAIDEIHRQGGIAIAAHPYSVFSFHDKIFELNFDAIEGCNSLTPARANAEAVSAAKKLGLPCTAVSDAHQAGEIGKGLMLLPEGTNSCRDVTRCIKEGNFKVSFSQTHKARMAIRYICDNLRLQLFADSRVRKPSG